MLAHMYFLGEGGLPQSSVEAYKWALIAGDAAPRLAIPLQMIEITMSAAQKNEATHLAEQWKFDKGLSKTPPGSIPTDDTVIYFLKSRQLATKCSSTNSADLAWCDAYIAGVFDTLGANRKNLQGEAEKVRFCLRNKTVSLPQARQAIGKAIPADDESLDQSAANSVIAGVLVYLCE